MKCIRGNGKYRLYQTDWDNLDPKVMGDCGRLQILFYEWCGTAGIRRDLPGSVGICGDLWGSTGDCGVLPGTAGDCGGLPGTVGDSSSLRGSAGDGGDLSGHTL